MTPVETLLTLSCKTPRDGMIVSAAFFLTGAVPILCGRYLAPEALYLPQLLQSLGLLLMPCAEVILVSALRLLGEPVGLQDPG